MVVIGLLRTDSQDIGMGTSTGTIREQLADFRSISAGEFRANTHKIVRQKEERRRRGSSYRSNTLSESLIKQTTARSRGGDGMMQTGGGDVEDKERGVRERRQEEE